MIFGEDPGTEAYVPGAQGRMTKISFKIFISEKQSRGRIDATVHRVHTIPLR